MPPPSRLLITLVVPLLLLAGAACSSDASTRTAGDDGGPTTTAAPVTAPETIPEGVTLRIGDQLEFLQTVLGLAGEDQDLPYDVEYSAFIGGPPMLQAFQGDAIDVGFVGSTPLIFAQAAGQEIKAVAGWASESGGYDLIAAPGSDIGGWADLEGRRVAYQRGTAGEAALLQALDAAGVDPAAVTTVDVPQTQVASTLQGGGADAGISVEPLTSAYVAGNEGAEVVDRASLITDRSSFLIATAETLADEGRTAALADYITRLVRSYDFLADNQDQVAQGVYVETYGLTPERAAEIQAENGPTRFYPLPDDVLAAQQNLADLFVAAGQIPTELDVSTQFDTRFNDLVTQEQGE